MARIESTAADRSTGSRSDRVATDRYYRALANERRRIAIRVLDGRDSLHLDALVDAIVSRLGGNPSRETVLLSLQHQHLPMLAEAGIVEYDEVDERVTLVATVEELPVSSGPEAT